jgi:undecaprenyl-diphosphatase
MAYDLFIALILGMVEGLTEFLPVSSTGHLILVGKYLTFISANQTTFDIAVQLGAIAAVVVIYRAHFASLIKNPLPTQASVQHLLWAFIPTMVVGFAAHGFIKKHLFSPYTVAYGLAAGALLMLWAEKKPFFKNPVQNIASITWKQAFCVGLFQCLSLWPGMSRSGSTISGGLLSGMHRSVAAQFSFILSVPVMCAAVAYDLYKSYHLLTLHDAYVIAVGMLTAFVTGYLCIRMFLSWVAHATLMPFVIYRMLLAGAVLYSFKGF